MSNLVQSWEGADSSGLYKAIHTVSIQDTADWLKYEIAGETQLSINVYEFEAMCHELDKLGYNIVWPTNI